MTHANPLLEIAVSRETNMNCTCQQQVQLALLLSCEQSIMYDVVRVAHVCGKQNSDQAVNGWQLLCMR